jgi:hypothetical protein
LETEFEDARLPAWQEALQEYRDEYPDVTGFAR